MKRTELRLMVLLVLLCLIPVGCGIAESQGFQFAAEMVAPSNQIDNVGYYHIPGEPGEQITLQAKLTNNTDQSLEIKVVPMNAYSSQTGIFYQNPADIAVPGYSLLDERYGLSQYINVTSPIQLDAGQTQIVTFTVSLPDLRNGTMLGSIRFVAFAGTQELQKANDQNGNAQMLIDKYQAVDTAIQIELPAAVMPCLNVGDPIFDGDQIGISVAIQNTAALIMQDIHGTYTIRDQKDTVLFTGDMASFKMSPMTTFTYPLSWQNKTLEAGSYTLSLTLNQNGQDVVFDKPFIISATGILAAQQTQQKINPEIKVNYPKWYVVAIELFVLALIFLFIRRLRLRGQH